ncbi:GAF domain-containing protein [Thermobifida halotolerans]|uniref:GAF domain-containing protein n=1 Tax=Thermobifida halotolerans TaxID=483545 RepID=A0A399G191_9ACTN|nr:GAF domain-containing protein [Thermobifida halotolerans]UOE19359.1 GAF domain-containing protein [Thermobifida halotolerans]
MPEHLAKLEHAIADLHDRVAALRATHVMYPDDAATTAEAALAELGFAERLLRECEERLAALIGPATSRRSDDERTLLRAVFNELSIPVVLLDHGGYIRRINAIGAERLGSTPGYLTGKPFSIFVDLRSRAAMRSWQAAVLQSGETVSFDSRLARRGYVEDVRLTVSRLTVPSEPNPLLLVAMSPPLRTSEDSGPAPLETEVEDQVVVLAARRLDVLTRMTRLLLRSAGPGGDHPPLVLDKAAELLADSYADWVIIDLCDAPGGPDRVRRAVVAGPPNSELSELVRALDAGAAEIPRSVLAQGKAVLRQLIDDETLLGRTPGGIPVLSALNAGSLLSVPLHGSQGVGGALTLIRRSNRNSFRLADQGLLEEIGEHIGLALPSHRC